MDSRLIVDYNPKQATTTGTNDDDANTSSSSSSPLLALRLSHILFASTELARQSLEKLTKAEWNFDKMAMVVSNCPETREEGGSVGWVNLNEDFTLSSYDTSS